jgi:predicted amidohydrolase YtcJ
MDPNPTDLLLTGGAVHTVSSGTAEAVAVQGGRITAVGSAADLATTVGATTRVVELEGRAVLPGFQDAHLHPPHGGLLAIECNLHESESGAKCLDTIARYAAEHPEREWIAGSGWSMDSFPGGTPGKESLDAIVPDRPVFVTNRDGHGAWVNSRALELAGIDSSTSDPPDGRIERGAGGEPSGTLHEGAMRAVQELVPATTAGEWEQAILNAQAQLHALGITAWQDATVLPQTLSAYRALAERGELTMRAEGNLLWDRTRDDEQIDELLAMREQGRVGRLRIRGAKIFQDGSASGALRRHPQPRYRDA